MNYKIVSDKNKLISFIDWLPELEDNEKYYLSLFARKKYCQELIKSNDKTQLKRFTSDKDRMLKKILQLEVPLGRWYLRDTLAPQQSLVLYINPNPRSMKKATQMMGKKCWDLMFNKNYNLHAEAMSCIQRSKSRGIFVDFDIDEKNIDLDLDYLDAIVGTGNYDVLDTRGGYHILVKPDLATKFREENGMNKNWYNDIKKTYPVDQTGDNMIPVAGCVQGGYIPKFISK